MCVCVCVCVCVYLEIEQGGHFFWGGRRITDGPCQISVHLALFLSNFPHTHENTPTHTHTHTFIHVRSVLSHGYKYVKHALAQKKKKIHPHLTCVHTQVHTRSLIKPHTHIHTHTHTHTDVLCSRTQRVWTPVVDDGCQSNDAKESGPCQV